jgi:hypothetical protein
VGVGYHHGAKVNSVLGKTPSVTVTTLEVGLAIAAFHAQEELLCVVDMQIEVFD